MNRDRLAKALAMIDAANGDDPHTLAIRGETRPKELAHAEMASAWVTRLCAEPSEALLLAARAHHVRRWAIPRADHPAGRKGYLTWRKALYKLHAETVGPILEHCGYPAELVEQVQALVAKRRLGQDGEAQTLEDALCMVFLETQLEGLADQLDDDHIVDVLRKTMKKMSAAAIEQATQLSLEPRGRALLARAARDDG